MPEAGYTLDKSPPQTTIHTHKFSPKVNLKDGIHLSLPKHVSFTVGGTWITWWDTLHAENTQKSPWPQGDSNPGRSCFTSTALIPVTPSHPENLYIFSHLLTSGGCPSRLLYLQIPRTWLVVLCLSCHLIGHVTLPGWLFIGLSHFAATYTGRKARILEGIIILAET